MPTSESFTATVIRITSGNSQRPSTSVCILARRRRKRLNTRSTAPSRSSTRTTNVYACITSRDTSECPERSAGAVIFVILNSSPCLFFNHIRDSFTRSDHRIHIRLWLDNKFHNHGALSLHGLLDSAGNVFPSLHTNTSHAISICQFDIIRPANGRL